MGAVCTLVAILASFDPRVRQEISLRVSAPPSAHVHNASATLRSVTSIVYEAVRDQSIDHGPLVIFVLAAVVLFLFMLRT